MLLFGPSIYTTIHVTNKKKTLDSPTFQRTQEIFIRWIFSNEDKVWRDRGGRPGEETLHSFMNFVLPEPDPVPGKEIEKESQPGEGEASPAPGTVQELEKPNHFGHQPFGGFVILGKDQTERDENGLIGLTTRQPYIVSYCVGDFVAPNKYEIVTGKFFS